MIAKLSDLGFLDYDKTFKQLTTLRVGGRIKYYFEPHSLKHLIEAIDFLNLNNINHKIIGCGSNILCSDNDYDGVVIKLSNLNHFEITDNELYAEAGSSLITIANFAINHGLAGLEFATGIPATVGGSIYMNASAYLQGISDVLDQVLVYKDRDLIWLSANELGFSYRTSVFQLQPDWIIVAASFMLKTSDKDTLKEISIERNQRRRTTQPLDLPNCGSVFRNIDDKMLVWQIIDNLDLRGYRVGAFEVSMKHANFIVNHGDGKAEDMDKLIKIIQDKCQGAYDVELHLEVERFNW